MPAGNLRQPAETLRPELLGAPQKLVVPPMSQQRLRELEEELQQDPQEEQGLDLSAPPRVSPQSPSLHAASQSQQMQPSQLLAVAMAAQMQKQSPQKPAGVKIDAGASSEVGAAGDAGARASKASSPAGGPSSAAVAGSGAGGSAPQGISAAPSGLVVVSSTRVERKLSVAEEQSRASPHSTPATSPRLVAMAAAAGVSATFQLAPPAIIVPLSLDAHSQPSGPSAAAGASAAGPSATDEAKPRSPKLVRAVDSFADLMTEVGQLRS